MKMMKKRPVLRLRRRLLAYHHMQDEIEALRREIERQRSK